MIKGKYVKNKKIRKEKKKRRTGIGGKCVQSLSISLPQDQDAIIQLTNLSQLCTYQCKAGAGGEGHGVGI